ncbi:MAG: nucleotidyltransferase domain-containing protein [Candidatus Woesearchaeota archaeon]|nr:nucleotidyltransferase domain-containing protein [Candidatus Woesearchaeota archaeon]
MLKKEYEILLQLAKEPWKKFTFQQIKKLSRKKSESYVYDSLKRFAKNGILKEEKAGNIILYCLNLKNPKALSYAGFVSEYAAWNQSHIPYKELQNIIDKMPASFYILIITGSYAKKTQRRDSDIDVVIIAEDSIKPGKIYAELSHYCELSIPKIHLYAFKKSEFLAMLLSKEANYGKEIAKNNLVLFGAEFYYRIICEAVENAFRG